MTAGLFAATVLIWGTTWLAIAVQVDQAPVLTAVFWRFAIAALALMGGLAATGRLRVPPLRQHPFLILQGLTIFGVNFLLIYNAERFITSGLVSVIFSLATVFNAVNARLFLGEPIAPRMLGAAAVGVSGVALLFWTDLGTAGAQTALGMGLAAAGTWCFSLGNMVARRNAAAGLPVMLSNGWGMSYGALALGLAVAVTGTPVAPPADPVWLGAAAYLALIGSVAGFGAYLGLVARIGPARAAYATVLFPAVALTLSSLIEGYVWHLPAMAGLALVCLANLIVFAPAAMRPAPAR